MVDQSYLSKNWSGAVPVDPTCASSEFKDFNRVNYRAFFGGGWVMSLFGFAGMALALVAGRIPEESGLVGFGKARVDRREVIWFVCGE